MAAVHQPEEGAEELSGRDDAAVRAELQSIVGSQTFAPVNRLARFLQFIVEQQLSGSSNRLKESVIGVEVYDRPPDYNPKVDSIVRTEARRLRKRLGEYYESEGRYASVIITVPTGGYVPQFEFRNLSSAAVPAAPDASATAEVFGATGSAHRKRKWWLTGLTLSLSAVGFAYWDSVYRHSRLERHKSQLVNPEAQRLYLEGRYFWAKRTPEADQKAISDFTKAVRLSPNFALGYSGLADAYAVTASGLPPSERFRRARAAADRALALDETTAEAHTSLAFILYKFEWNWAEAERHFRRAIELKASYALAHHWFGEFLVLARRPEEGIARLREAAALDPVSLPIKNDLARAMYRTRHYDEAITGARQTLELDPNFKNAYSTLTYAYEQKHDYKEAMKADLEVVKLSGASAEEIASLITAFNRSGWRGYWQKQLELLRKAPPHSVSAYVFAEAYLRAGDKKAALDALEQSFDNHGDAPLLIGVEPLLDPLRSDPRFQFLIRRSGLGI